MKPISEWDEGDLRALIANEVQESLELDYKRSDALGKTEGKKGEISKDVSAFANSAGGRIIYGIIEKDNKPVDLDAGSDPKQITREWLEQVINSTIQQRIPGVRIKAIPLSTGGHAFVVEVPPSATGPHQANDMRYYKRFEFQSVPMHDYEVRDVAGRATNPALDLEWKLLVSEPVRGGEIQTQIDLVAVNRSAAPALYSAVTFYLDAELHPTLTGMRFSSENIKARDHNGRSSAHRYSRVFAIPTDHPIYRERPLSLTTAVVQSKPYKSYCIGYTMTCPGFSLAREGTLIIEPREPRLYLEWFDD